MEQPIPVTLIQESLWRRLDGEALERGRVVSFRDGYLLDGRVLTLVEGRPAEVHYSVHAGPDWVTRFAFAIVLRGTRKEQVQARRGEDGRWYVDEVHRPEFDGLFDIDLAFSPATNTLPIRRLALAVGASASTDAVWIRFPALACERLPQHYERVAERHYRYESNGGAFVADLQVDEHGVVTEYGGIWQRSAASTVQ